MNMVTTEAATRRDLHSLIVDKQLPVPRDVSFHDSTERCHVWLTFDHPHNVLAWTRVLNLAPCDSIWRGRLDGWTAYVTVVGAS